MTEKRYQVFVSATYLDLIQERAMVMQGLMALGCLPVGMDMHSTGAGAWPTIKKLIDDCDYYLLLLGSRYGSLSPSGVSYAHMEYVYATTKQKPILVLLHEAPDSRPRELQETTAEGKVKFQDFRNTLLKGLHARWNNPKDLDLALKRHLPALIQNRPMPGWVRAGVAGGAEQERELSALHQRVVDLEGEREQWLSLQARSQGELAFGDDEFELLYACKAYAGGNCEAMSVRGRMSWKQIFQAVAPFLLEPISEETMLDKLVARVAEQALSDVQRLKPKAHAVTEITLHPQTFGTIKVQLRMLGLIRRVVRPGEPASKPFWALTMLGEQHMTSIMAVRRPSPR